MVLYIIWIVFIAQFMEKNTKPIAIRLIGEDILELDIQVLNLYLFPAISFLLTPLFESR